MRAKLQGKVLYVTCDDRCYKIVEESAVEVEYLSCDHEEADTRVFVHARHAEEASSAIILAPEDTDVFVISLSLVHTFNCPIFMKSGTRNRERYIHVQKVACTVGHGTCCALPGMHSFTGCDSVSAFSGKGKVSAFKLLQKNKKYQEAFTQLGKEWSVPESIFAVLQEFTCRLYASRSPIATVNDLRFQLFRAKKGDVESGQLPPCKDCLLLHTRRANYQSGVWRRALEHHQSLPSPVGHGWCIEDGKLDICWMTGSPAPDVVIEFLSCKCSRVCKLPTCTCLANGLKCTVTCKLQECNNWQEEDSATQSESEDSDDE